MPDIPYTPIPEQPRTSGNPVLANPNAAAAPWRAAAQAGQAVSQVGGQMFQISQQRRRELEAYQQKKQKLTDDAGLARTNTEANHAVAMIDAEIAQNPNDHESWSKIAQEGWTQYRNDLNERLGKSGMTEEAIQSAMIRIDAISQKHQDEVFLKQTTRDVQLKQQAIVINAEDYYRNELWDYGDREVDKLGLPEAQADEMKRELRGKGQYDRILRTIDDMEMDPNPVASMEGLLDSLREREKGEIGENEVNVYAEFPGLQKEGRDRLDTILRSRIKQYRRQQTKTVRDVFEDAGTGKINAVEARQTLEEAKVPEERIQHLENIIKSTEVTEENSSQVEFITDQLNQNWAEQIFNGDRNEKEYLEILTSIDDLKASKATKLRLTQEWLDAWNADISDSKLELVGRKELTLTRDEVNFHNNLFQVYKQAIQDTPLPLNVVGGMLTSQIRDFTDWYASQDPAPDQETLNAKMQTYMRELYGNVSETETESSVSGW